MSLDLFQLLTITLGGFGLRLTKHIVVRWVRIGPQPFSVKLAFRLLQLLTGNVIALLFVLIHVDFLLLLLLFLLLLLVLLSSVSEAKLVVFDLLRTRAAIVPSELEVGYHQHVATVWVEILVDDRASD